MKNTELMLSNEMLDALIAINSRVVTIKRATGIMKIVSLVKEDGQESDIKLATVDALIRRNLVNSYQIKAYRLGSGSESRLRLANGVAEHFPLGVGLL